MMIRAVLPALLLLSSLASADHPAEPLPNDPPALELDAEIDQLIDDFLADGESCWDSSRRLRELGNAAVPALEDLVLLPDPDVRQRAIQLLAQIDDREPSFSGDANMAAAALHGLGPVVVPDLRARLARADAQETLLLRLLLHHLAGPDDPNAAVPETEQRRAITGRVHDPVTQHRFNTMPRF